MGNLTPACPTAGAPTTVLCSTPALPTARGHVSLSQFSSEHLLPERGVLVGKEE